MNRCGMVVTVVGVVIAAARAEALTITVVEPAPTTRIRHQVDIYVNAETAFEITSAQATLDGATEPLTPFASCGTHCVRFFAELTPLPPDGDQAIAVEMTDASGATATISAPFIFDRPVSVALNVKPNTVTGTTMRLRGTCDDNGAPCASVDLWFVTNATKIARTIVDVAAFDELFDLTPVADQSALIVAIGHDGFPGGEAVVSTDIAVNNSPRLLQIVQATGQIDDADLGRVLHDNALDGVPAPLGISIYDRASATDTQITTEPKPPGGVLTANGALWPIANNQVALYRNNAIETLPTPLVRVSGNYLVWQESLSPFRTHLLELTTGTTSQFSHALLVLPAANGVLYYLQQSTNDLIRRAGTVETFVANGRFPLATDGNLVVAFVLGACGVEVFDASGAVDELDTAPCSTWQASAWVQDGWVVYFEVRALSVPPYQMFALHSRAPDGTRYLLADNLLGVGFEGVSPTGEVMYREGGRRYLVSPGHAPVDVATSLGRGMWRDGYWLVAMNDTLFALDVIPPIPPPAAPPDGAPDASPDAAPGTSSDAGFPASDAGTGAESDATPGVPGASLQGRSGCSGCSAGGATPPALLALVVLCCLGRVPRRRARRA